MTTSNESLTFQDVAAESQEEKGSFDAEFSLLESTLTELKDECASVSKNDVGEVAEDVVDLFNNSISNNYNGINYDSVKSEISNQDIKDYTDFDNITMFCKKCEPKRQHCESVNVPVPVSNVLVSSCTLVSQDGTSNLDCSTSKIKYSNNDLNKDSELESSKPFTCNNENLKSDIVISICDSSVDLNKNNQLASSGHSRPAMINMNNETIVSVNMDLERNTNNYDNTVDTCKSTTSNIKIEVSELPSHESSLISIPNCPHTSDNSNVIKEPNIKSESYILENYTSSTNQNLPNCDFNGIKSQDIKLCSKAIIPCKNIPEDGKDLPLAKAEIVQATTQNNNTCNGKNNEVHLSTTFKLENNSTYSKNVSENISNLKNYQEEITIVSADLGNCKENSNIYCSTPVASNSFFAENKQNEHLNNTTNFGQMSPLNAFCKKNRMDLKRKFLGLQCIDEVDEDASDICDEKRSKHSQKEDHHLNEENLPSSTACFEVPAKSILKKWQISNISRSSGSSFYILDECGESDGEEKQDIAANNASCSAPADEFEIACKSLNEELMKEGSFNIEELEKYYSKVLMENQIDNENFDEVLQELSLNYGIDYKAPQSLNTAEKSLAAEPTTSVKTEVSSEFEINTTTIAIKCESGANECKDKTIKYNALKLDSSTENDPKLIIKVKENVSEHIEADDIQRPNSSRPTSTIEPENSLGLSSGKNMTIIYADGEDMAIDEEDVLLKEDTSTKPYEFHEYVSSDPKENEDNYNPEWQKLGRLTTDEERYKAVRDRWRSLVPPDPNRDLTCRQWRKKNQKPPLNYPSRNNNHHMHSSNERNQLCTAVFEMKIKKIIDELDERRMEILHKRHRDFNGLSIAQDREYSLMSMRGASGMDLTMLGKQHIEECKGLKNQYDMELDKMSRITEEKIKILKDASEEVLLFQKFYKGFGAGDDKVCLYMTDIQVQELMETEDMLEQYNKFYK